MADVVEVLDSGVVAEVDVLDSGALVSDAVVLVSPLDVEPRFVPPSSALTLPPDPEVCPPLGGRWMGIGSEKLDDDAPVDPWSELTLSWLASALPALHAVARPTLATMGARIEARTRQ